MEHEKKGYFSMRQVVERSIVFENDSARFYRDLRTKTDIPAALELLTILEKQELEHAATLERLLDKEETADVYIQFPPELDLSLPEPPPGNPGFSELLDVAIDRERLSAEIYMSASANAPAPIKILLEGLSEFERIHERGLKELKLT
jgi:rubrerythrin